MARNIPTPQDPSSHLDQFASFVDIVRILRTDCPWDREQTHESISHLLIEEAYETLDAIRDKNDQEFSKELGDLLLHVVMHAVIAEERGSFSLTQLIERISAKLVHRHPHVFGDTSAESTTEVLQNWESQKMKEGRTSILEGVPKQLPALLRAQRTQEKAANVGFDWDKREDVWAKVEEEIRELKEEIFKNDLQAGIEEFGDVLFALVNAGRFEGYVAEEALQTTTNKFTRRFQYIEKRAREEGRNLKDMTLAEMDEWWNEAKALKI
ncbi:MAG: nucleoside triphosphate pyrophosphohydrolase [Candidatus Kapaibacterium sp.]|jgi:XTP/dITP diphosphohydrolase